MTISKSELNRILITQEELKSEVASLRELILNSLKDEIKPSIIKRLNERSKRIDDGSGRRFDSTGSLKSYLRSL